MNRGSARSGRAAATAGLKRSVWPTAKTASAFAAAAIMTSASTRLRAIGFSTRTAAPAFRNGSAISQWRSVGTAMVTASTCPARSRASYAARVPCAAAISSARARFVSATATSFTPDSDARIRA